MDNENEFISKEEVIKSINEEIVTKDDIEDEDENIQLDENDKKLIVAPADPDVQTLFNEYNDGYLILQPKFQRNYVMSKKIANKLIESLLIGVPLPMFYFAEEEKGRRSVIDGQQRLTAIFSFKNGKFLYDNQPFKLNGLEVLKELNGKSFKDLDDELKMKINRTSLRVVTIKKESNPDLKFEIFERLNTGSTPLNEDEIRNTVFRGEFIDMLAELEENELFNNIVNKENFKNRMLYRGMILRFFAFYERTYLNYKPSMKQFCNSFLRDNRHLSEEKRENFIKVFKDALNLVYSTFGNNAFRRLVKDENSNNSSIITNRINMALFDIEMWGFTRYKKEQVYPKLDQIREEMYNLMISDQQFVNSIQLKTSNADMVKYRFETWQKKLESIITQKATPRLFSYEQRKKLFEEDPTCKLCGQQILNIDDANVDHILASANGGGTIEDNAQITHRWCNLHKSDKKVEDVKF